MTRSIPHTMAIKAGLLTSRLLTSRLLTSRLLTSRLLTAGLLTAGLLTAGCKSDGEKKPDKAQKAQIQELRQSSEELKSSTQELLKRRGTIQRSRSEIEAARAALEKKRASLAKDDIAGHAALAKEELALRKKEKTIRKQEDQIEDKLLASLRRQEQFFARTAAALAASSSGGSDESAGVRGREHAVALREKAVAARERDVARREAALNEQYRKIVDYKAKKCAVAQPVFTTISAPAAPPPGTGSHTYSKADARNALARAMSVMNHKGIRTSDLPSGFAKLIGDIRKFISGKEYARAKFAADQLRSTLMSIKVDRGFVGAKMGRLASVIRGKKLSDAKRKKVNSLFVEVTTAYNDGRFASANSKINKIYRIIR